MCSAPHSNRSLRVILRANVYCASSFQNCRPSLEGIHRTCVGRAITHVGCLGLKASRHACPASWRLPLGALSMIIGYYPGREPFGFSDPLPLMIVSAAQYLRDCGFRILLLARCPIVGVVVLIPISVHGLFKEPAEILIIRFLIEAQVPAVYQIVHEGCLLRQSRS